ncbi:MAG: leucine-rich repeat protein, partial [Oscillospiraceae bacterium]|nr:leucine-rich repeat protein [Oscillospiraceae bacterium]
MTIAGANVIDENAFYNCLSLKNVTASHGLTTINDNAFAKCKELVHLDLPGTVTYIAVNAIDETALYNDTANWENGILYVGKYLFKTTNLNYEELVVRDGTTVIGEGVFQDFTSLKKLTLPHSVTTIQQSAFSGCSGLTSVVIPETVKSIERRAFYNCTGLERVAILGNITSFGIDVFRNCSHLSSVTIAGATSVPSGAFEACAALEEITIPADVTFLGDGAFLDCVSLQKVTFSTAYIEEIEFGAFENCVSLKSIDIPEGVEILMWDTFRGCTALESVTIPESVRTLHPDAFSNCTSLKSIYIPKNVTYVGEKFGSCTALTAIWVDEENSAYSSDENGVMYNKSKTALFAFPRGYVGEYVIPHTVTTIGESSFSSCKKLTSITIPVGIKSIGDYAFRYCTNLESVTLPQGITTLGQQAFIGCTALRSISIPNTLTSIGDDAFSGCKSMERFCVEEGNPNYSADEYGVLYNADKTKLLMFPAGYQGAFVVPESVTNIDHGAFSSAKGLTAVTIPGTVYAITSNCFSGCTNLTEVTICEGVASLYNHAFYGCRGLQTVVLPKSVRSTDYMTFAGCTNLTDLYILNPRCSFASGPAPIADPEITTLYGEVGSTTEQYATKNGFKFMPLTDSVKITINHSVELANELSINYMVRADLLQSYEGYDYTMKVVLPVYEGNTQTGTTTMELQPVLKGNYYYFILTGLNATRMNDTMQATLHISNGLRQVLSQTDSYSIATYAYNQLRKEGGIPVHTVQDAANAAKLLHQQGVRRVIITLG